MNEKGQLTVDELIRLLQRRNGSEPVTIEVWHQSQQYWATSGITVETDPDTGGARIYSMNQARSL